jgi:large conductance mechanosensitive channel
MGPLPPNLYHGLVGRFEKERQTIQGGIVVQEFRDFILRGNLIEMAVAFVMGIAFAALTASFVDDLVMPIIAAIFGEADFSDLTFTINDAVFYYGSFLTALVVFLTTALALFLFVVKPYNAYQARSPAGTEEDETAPEEDIQLLTEIRDALVHKN